MFVLIYGIMMIALGIVVIMVYEKVLKSSARDKALAMGSMALITGVVMLVDFALLVKKILKK